MNLESQILNTLNLLLTHPVTLDVETTTKNKGNAFTQSNQLVTVQSKVAAEPAKVFFRDQFKVSLHDAQKASMVIGFNLKFDLHWLRREFGYQATCVWDCQLAEFMLSKQTNKYPSLEDTCIKYGVGHKLDIVKTEYWDKGIDTTEIPQDVLAEYGAQDVDVTYAIFLKQVEQFKTTHQHMFKLFRLHCNDLLVLQEMEYNGIMYDIEASITKAEKLQQQVINTETEIRKFTDGIPINFDSRDHMSCLLYGGTISIETRFPVGVYKTGAKTGLPRYKLLTTDYTLERRVEPPKGSELKKEGYFSTDETTLLSIKTNKTNKYLIERILERAKLMKLKSTYLEGLPNTLKEMEWEDNLLHSNLNQCVATTGRLSSTKPNQQNLPKEAKIFCVSRYK